MKNKLPVYIENRELPIDEYRSVSSINSYGYVSILYLASIIITVSSVLVVIFFGNRWFYE